MTDSAAAVTDTTEDAATLKDAYVEPSEKRVLDPEKIGDSLLERMPSPTGWRILILPFKGKEKTAGGIILADSTLEQQQVSTQVGYVLKVGPLAYKDTEKVPDGPWSQEREWVMFARYSGSRFNIDGGAVRILNDDEVLARISNPEDIINF